MLMRQTVNNDVSKESLFEGLGSQGQRLKISKCAACSQKLTRITLVERIFIHMMTKQLIHINQGTFNEDPCM